MPLRLIETTRRESRSLAALERRSRHGAEMSEAISSYATQAAEKMRRYKVAADLFVFMHTSTFNEDSFYSNGASARSATTTNDIGELVALATRQGEQLCRDGFRYSKCGVVIS